MYLLSYEVQAQYQTLMTKMITAAPVIHISQLKKKKEKENTYAY